MYTSKNEVVAEESLANQYTELIVGLAIKIRNSLKSKFIFAFSIAKKRSWESHYHLSFKNKYRLEIKIHTFDLEPYKDNYF